MFRTLVPEKPVEDAESDQEVEEEVEDADMKDVEVNIEGVDAVNDI